RQAFAVPCVLWKQNQSTLRRAFQLRQPFPFMGEDRRSRIEDRTDFSILDPRSSILASSARNAMVRAGHVNEVGVDSWHVAIDATIAWTLPPAVGERKLTAILLMTSQAALAIMGCFRLWRQRFMWFV